MRRSGVDPRSVVSAEARLGEGVRVGAGAVVEAGARLGDGVVVGPCAYVGPGVEVGEGSVIEAGAVLLEGVRLGRRVTVRAGAVLGTDGFGFVPVEGRQEKIPQVGGVEVGDGAIIGAGTCVDRATTGTTRVGEEARLGNLVQVAHNVQVGRGAWIEDQAGVAGSCRVGDGCRLGFQSALAQQCHLGDRSRLGVKGAAVKNYPPDTELEGYPARSPGEAARIEKAVAQLPEALKRLTRLERRA